MRKLLSLTAAALIVTVAPAAAKTVTVAITKSGYVPRTVSIAVGDSVTFANQDTVAHQVVLRPTTGVTCSPSPVIVQPGQSATCTFRSAGRFAVSDAANKKAAFKGTITVAAAAGAAVTLKAAPPVVTYGAKATISGTIATGQPNQKVDLLAQECGVTAFRSLTAMTTTTNGAFTSPVQPLKTTTYEARFKGSTSAQALVRVRPDVRLSRVARQRFAVRVRAAQSFVGKAVVFQRYSTARRAWVRVRTVTLSRTVASVAPTVVSGATFKARVRARLRVRAVLPLAQASPCYAAAASNVVRS